MESWRDAPLVNDDGGSSPSWRDAPLVDEQGGLLSNGPDDGYASGAAKGLGTAAIKGLSNSVGTVGNLGNFADYLLARGESAITGKPHEEILKDMRAQREKISKGSMFPSWTDPRNVLPSGSDVSNPILAKTGEYVPASEPGRIAQGGAEAAFSALGPGGGGAAGTGREILAAAPAMALGNAAGGAAATAVTDATDDPLLGLAAGIGGGVVAQGAAAAGRKAGLGAPTRVAGQRLLDQSSDPGALRDWAVRPDDEPDVPGSPRTTAGSVENDRGLFQAEKDARNIDNIPFNALDRAQSDAQQAAIRRIQPDGDVFLPGKMIRQRMDALDDAAREAEERLNAAHQDAVTARAQGSQDFANRLQAKVDADHARLVQTFAEAHERAEAAARDGGARLGERSNAEDLGSTLRAALEEVRSEVKKVHRDLYNAVDPDGNLALVASAVRDRALEIGAQIKADGSEFDPVEAGLFRRASALPNVIPYRMLNTLDRDISAAMSKERRGAGETPALARLTQLKGAVKDAMIQAADNQAQHEARVVDAGLMAKEHTIGSRLAQETAEFQADRKTAARRSDAASGGDDRATFGPSAFRSANGSEVPGIGRPGDASRDQGVQSSQLQPNFDEAGAQRLKDANAAYADYARLYKNPIIAAGLKTTGYSGQYRMPDAAFIRRAVIPGDRGYEVAKAHIAALKDAPRGVGAMLDAVLDPLRRAVAPDGTIHPNMLRKWKESYGPALRALEEVSPGFSSHFDSAAEATQTMLDLGAQQKEALTDFQKQSAAHVLGLIKERRSDDAALNAQSKVETSAGIARARGIAKEARQTPAGQFALQGGDRIAPAEVENAVGNLLKTGTDGATRMRSLVQSLSINPDALAGLRKAGVDWIIRTHQNADGSMSGAKFIKFIRDNRDTLKELYPESQISTFAAIARDIELNAKWRTETAIKGGSDTAKNSSAIFQKAINTAKRRVSILDAATAGYLSGGGFHGAAAGAGLYLLGQLHSAGIGRIEDLYREALLNPDVAKALIVKMPEKTDDSALQRAIRLLRRPVIVGPGLVENRKGSNHADLTESTP